MSATRPQRINWAAQPWTPAADVAAMLEGISGNAVNGVGEGLQRAPRQIFWSRKPETLVHEKIQRYTVDRFNNAPAFETIYTKADRGPRLDAPAPLSIEKSAAQWTIELKAFALNRPALRAAGSEAELAGVAEMNPLWVYQGYASDLPHLLLLAIKMDHALLSEVCAHDAANLASQIEVADQYNRGARAANFTAQWIRAQGFQAKPHAGPWVGSLSLVPAALAAGFGELGKHGSIINRELGSSFRLAAVETDMPLVADAPDRFGADDFCTRCRVCTDACPPQAINNEKADVRGERKWWVDFDKCMPYFNQTYGCGICIAVCPWSTPGRAPKLAERWGLRLKDAK